MSGIFEFISKNVMIWNKTVWLLEQYCILKFLNFKRVWPPYSTAVKHLHCGGFTWSYFFAKLKKNSLLIKIALQSVWGKYQQSGSYHFLWFFFLFFKTLCPLGWILSFQCYHRFQVIISTTFFCIYFIPAYLLNLSLFHTSHLFNYTKKLLFLFQIWCIVVLRPLRNFI